MRFVKIAVFLLTAALVFGDALAQDEVIARAYSTVNVRSGPGTQYDIIGQLTSGNEVQITGRSDDESNWLRIDLQGREGWVAFFTVSVLDETSQLPLVEPRTVLANPIERATATPAMISASSEVYVTAYRRVNVRSGPGTEYVRVGNLEAGSTADVTGRSEDDEWLRIDFGQGSGWVAFFVVNVSGSLSDIRIAEAPAGAATDEFPNTVEIVTRYNVNLRASPALDSPVIDIVPFRTPLQAEARSNPAGLWLQVTYNDQTGWLIRALVIASGELDILPIRQR